jgi:hypothetical protein
MQAHRAHPSGGREGPHRLRSGSVLLAGLLVLIAWMAATVALPVTASAGIPHLAWTDVYGPTTGDDQWRDIARGPGHTIYVAGVLGFTQGPGWQMTIAKYDAAGTRVWATPTIPGVKTWLGLGANARGNALAVDRTGDAIAAGSSASSSGGFAVVKFSGADGHVVWEQDLRLTGAAAARDVVVDRDGNAYVTGYAETGTGSAMFTVKLAGADGAKKWQNLYSGPQHEGEGDAIAIDAGRNTYVAGYVIGAGGFGDWAVRKISPAGTTRWTNRWDGASHLSDGATQVITTANGGAIYIMGQSAKGAGGRYDGILMRYSARGHRVWLRRFGKSATSSWLEGLCFDSRGAILACGASRPLDASKPTATLLVKLSAGGRRAWLRSSTSPYDATQSCGYSDVVRGPSGSMYLGGSVQPGVTDYGMLIEKRRASGSLAWRAQFSWPDAGDDRAGKLLLDGTTGLYVTGSLSTTAGFLDAVLQRYEP